jgi:hypothetical protein
MSAICEYMSYVPVCGSNGPPGRWYFADGQLRNCGYAEGGRSPLVVMNEALWSWLFALAVPVALQVEPQTLALELLPLAVGQDEVDLDRTSGRPDGRDVIPLPDQPAHGRPVDLHRIHLQRLAPLPRRPRTQPRPGAGRQQAHT